jgi:hypothetical protein
VAYRISRRPPWMRAQRTGFTMFEVENRIT